MFTFCMLSGSIKQKLAIMKKNHCIGELFYFALISEVLLTAGFTAAHNLSNQVFLFSNKLANTTETFPAKLMTSRYNLKNESS